ncbi:MAG: MarR family transcriptional regulator [Roseburia sp.]|uniref:MarR family winged helix-turn-helix transcriptional regulator n=1 Tax=Roseburia sp. 831b TaxID=1261635 RepID=UPI000951ACE3|nr:MarR family transcriptional regulator [Roseburia sp. 831b]MCI5920107.1 MarR family transcriptional regulator [Roseburia sp.]MDD6216733.1 MarR family transcriptional regulator [Roseburia sp.]MDY5882338.1 MarR family transcriptional regulator [Roseburia sp.]WVK72662.1 MarR family transcriptional regulator [Roseburia sp. 831b]
MDSYEKLKLENQLCFPFYAISREIIKKYKPVLDPFHLTYTQYITMLVLWEKESITFKELGQKLHLDSGTMTPVVKKLEQMKLIHKYRTREDDRVVMVELTEQGRSLKEEIVKVPEAMSCQMQLEPEEALQLRKLLDKMLQQF